MEKTMQDRTQSNSFFFPKKVCTSMAREVSLRSILMVNDIAINICCLSLVERDAGGGEVVAAFEGDFCEVSGSTVLQSSGAQRLSKR